MATRSEFTGEEREALRKGVTGAGMLVSLDDRDFIDTFGEAGALAKRLREEHEQSSSELVREIAAVHGSGFGFMAWPQKVEAETLEALRAATATLAAKAPDELAAYKKARARRRQFCREREGGVREGETAAIGKITEALGIA